MNKKIGILSLLFAFAVAGGASANWEYPGNYAGYGSYHDDGSRFTISFRGGLSYQHGKMQNDLGSLVPDPYYIENATGLIVSEAYCQVTYGGACPDTDFTFAGQVDVAELGASKNLSKTAWASSVAVGFTIPYSPQWRLEAEWDHIAEVSYNSSPMFEGVIESTTGHMLNILSTGVNSTITTDIISAMVYYDFFNGHEKPVRTFIPYIGAGLGYAMSSTVLNLTDLYGDLSNQASFQEFGEDNGSIILDFYQSKTDTSNIAGVLAAGFSYGFMENVFFDFGAKLAYVPNIKWAINNEENASAPSFKSKDIFSAQDVFFVNILLGIRFEF